MEKRRHSECDDPGQRGFVLIMIVLLVLPLLLLAGSAMRFLSSTGKLTREVIDQSCALQAVEAAIDFAVYRGNTGALAGALTATGTLSNGATWTFSAASMATDSVDNDLDSTTDEADEKGYQVIATGQYRNAKKRVVAYVRSIATIPALVAAVTMEDPNAVLNINGNAFTMTGNDYNIDGSASGNPSVYGVTVNDPGTTAHLLSSLSNPQKNRITGTGGAPSASTSTLNFDDTFTSLKPVAHNVLATGHYTTISNFGDAATDTWRITYCTGDMTISGNQPGAGILVVAGDLTISGNVSYVGLVIVLGNIRFSGGGSGKLIRGGLLINGDASVGDVFGINGGVDIQYSSQAVTKAQNMTNRMTLAGWREVSS